MRSGFSRGSAAAKRLDAGEVGAVGAGARREFGMAIEQNCDIAPLHGCGDRLDAVDQRPLVALLEPQQHGGDVAGVQGRVEVAQECRRVAEWRRDEIEALGGRAFIAGTR